MNELDLLNADLTEESQKYLSDLLENFKEEIAEQLTEQYKELEAQKLEELEEENQAYKEKLNEEYSEKMIDALELMEDKIKAKVTAEVIKSNPELKILESIKDIVAPLINEDYEANTYSKTILSLEEELAELRRKEELREGAEELSRLLEGYEDNPLFKEFALSVIKEGTAEEVREQFFDIAETFERIALNEAEEDETEDDEAENADEDEDKPSKKSKKSKKASDDDTSDEEDDDDEDEDDEDENDEDDDDEDDEDDTSNDDEVKEESYLNDNTKTVISEDKKVNNNKYKGLNYLNRLV